MVDIHEPSWPAEDLLHTVRLGRQRGHHLLTPNESAVLDRLNQLGRPALAAYARLSVRRHEAQRLDRCTEHHLELEEQGWLDHQIAPDDRLRLSTVPDLTALLKTHGHSPPRSKRREALLLRVEELGITPSSGDFRRVKHRDLFQRLRRMATLRAFPDPANPVLERIGVRSWPSYATTGGALLWSHRPHLLGWESIAARREFDPPGLTEALSNPHASAPGKLSLRPWLRRALLDAAAILERPDPAEAIRLYTTLADDAGRHGLRARLRLALLLEREGQGAEALALLRSARATTVGPGRLTLHRTGRRLARSQRQGWAPDKPLPTPSQRRLELAAVPTDGVRPLFGSGVPVEAATIEVLHRLGRTALHAEGGLWRHLFALLFSPRCYFAPVTGTLPAERLSGPLDLGTPGFAGARPEAIEFTQRQIRTGRARELVGDAHQRFAGTLLAGARWERSVTEDQALVDAIGPALLGAVMQQLLDHGLRRSKGLPDLLILPGPAIDLPRAHPRRLPPEVLLAELKTPNDTLSDAQRWWASVLHGVVRTEVWQVQPTRHTRGC